MAEAKPKDPLMKKVDGSRLGVLQTGGEDHRKPDDPPEELTPFEQMEKRVYVNLLGRWITPNKLGPESTDQQDRMSFTKKIEGQTLAFLRRFFEEDVPDEVIASVQTKYKDLSP